MWPFPKLIKEQAKSGMKPATLLQSGRKRKQAQLSGPPPPLMVRACKPGFFSSSRPPWAATRRISSSRRRRKKQIDIVCSRGRWSRPPALPFFGPLQFQAGRACYACALGRSYFGRAAAPRALGPWIMPPAWTVPALPGLAMPSGACARSSRGRWSWSASAWTARPDHLERRVRPAFPGSSCAFFPRRFSPRIGPGFPPVTRAAGDSPAHNASPRRFPA